MKLQSRQTVAVLLFIYLTGNELYLNADPLMPYYCSETESHVGSGLQHLRFVCLFPWFCLHVRKYGECWHWERLHWQQLFLQRKIPSLPEGLRPYPQPSHPEIGTPAGVLPTFTRVDIKNKQNKKIKKAHKQTQCCIELQNSNPGQFSSVQRPGR